MGKENISSSEEEEDSDNNSGPSRTVYNGSVGNKSSEDSDSDSDSSRGKSVSQLTKKESKRSPKSPKSSSSYISPMKRIPREFPDFKKIYLDEELSESDEIAILEFPKYLNPAHFENRKISLEKKTKIKIEGTKYCIRPCVEKLDPILILTNKLQYKPLIAKLQLQEYIKSKIQVEAWNEESGHIPFPDQLRDRHPIFGVEYKSKLELNEDVQKRLNGEYIRRKTKKKKKKNLENTRELNSEETLGDSLTNILSRPQSHSFSDEYEKSHKKEKKKQKKSESIIEDKDNLIENLINDSLSSFLNAKKQNESVNSHRDEETSDYQFKKEKSKKRKSEKIKQEQSENKSNDLLDESLPQSLKNISNSRKHNLSFQEEENFDVPIKKDKKKKRKTEESNNDDKDDTSKLIHQISIPKSQNTNDFFDTSFEGENYSDSINKNEKKKKRKLKQIKVELESEDEKKTLIKELLMDQSTPKISKSLKKNCVSDSSIYEEKVLHTKNKKSKKQKSNDSPKFMSDLINESFTNMSKSQTRLESISSFFAEDGFDNQIKKEKSKKKKKISDSEMTPTSSKKIKKEDPEKSLLIFDILSNVRNKVLKSSKN